MDSWPFDEAKETLALTSVAVVNGRPVVFVLHDDYGAWHCLDGRQVFTGDELTLVPLATLVQRDPTLTALADLPNGWRAWRTSQHVPWEREALQQKDKTLARTQALLDRLRQTSIPMPPEVPGTTDLIREDRGR